MSLKAQCPKCGRGLTISEEMTITEEQIDQASQDLPGTMPF